MRTSIIHLLCCNRYYHSVGHNVSYLKSKIMCRRIEGYKCFQEYHKYICMYYSIQEVPEERAYLSKVDYHMCIFPKVKTIQQNTIIHFFYTLRWI